MSKTPGRRRYRNLITPLIAVGFVTVIVKEMFQSGAHAESTESMIFVLAEAAENAVSPAYPFIATLIGAISADGRVEHHLRQLPIRDRVTIQTADLDHRRRTGHWESRGDSQRRGRASDRRSHR